MGHEARITRALRPPAYMRVSRGDPSLQLQSWHRPLPGQLPCVTARQLPLPRNKPSTRDRKERSKRAGIGVAQPGWGLNESFMLSPCDLMVQSTLSANARPPFALDQTGARFADRSRYLSQCTQAPSCKASRCMACHFAERHFTFR